MKKIEVIIKPLLKKNISDIRPGDTVKVFQRFLVQEAESKSDRKSKGDKTGKKEKIQTFEGIVIAKKHGKEMGATITVRRVIDGIGVERIFPIHLPTIKKIEIIKRSKVRRAKLYYLRTAKGKRARLKRKEFTKTIVEEPKEKTPVEETTEEKKETKEKEENK